MDENWNTVSSFGFADDYTQYQESSSHARILVDGCEVVSPSHDMDNVYRQYNARYGRMVEEIES